MEADFEKVAEHLRKMGLNAEVCGTGGGIDCVFVYLADDWSLVFGTSSDMWGADVDHKDECTGISIWSDVHSETRNALKVARGLKRAVDGFLIGGGKIERNATQ